MRRFYQSVDLRSRSQMTDFLTKHFRYPTMNSWNNAVSYACNLKIHSLGLCDEVYEKLYDLLECQEFFLALKELISVVIPLMYFCSRTANWISSSAEAWNPVLLR